MKNKILGLAALLLTSVIAFAFKAEPRKVLGTLFQLNTVSAPHSPAAYGSLTIDPSVDCPGQSRICVIDVPTTDIYTSGANVGKPRVDLNTAATNELYDDIEAALNGASDGVSQNGRIIYEKQP